MSFSCNTTKQSDFNILNIGNNNSPMEIQETNQQTALRSETKQQI